MKGLLSGALLLTVLGATPAAQVRVVRYDDDRLTGIAAVDVLVTLAGMEKTSIGTTGIDKTCVIERTALQTRAIDVLRRSGVSATLSEVARSSHYSLVVEVQTATTGDHCASAVATELVAEVSGIPESDRLARPGQWGSLLVGVMPLASEKALVIRSSVEHDAAVRGAVEQQVATVAARIRSANQ